MSRPKNSPSPLKTKPLLIGITGGIGSGKSTVCHIFQLLGVPVYDADSRAKWLMAHDPFLKTQIMENFGEQSYQGDGLLNRAYLAEKVFHDEKQLGKLNGLVHPRVGQDFETWVQKAGEQPYLLKEAALLFESGSYQSLHATILVTAPETIRLERVLKRDAHRTRGQIEAIMAKQLPETESRKRATALIHNDGMQLLIPQVLQIHESLALHGTLPQKPIL